MVDGAIAAMRQANAPETVHERTPGDAGAGTVRDPGDEEPWLQLASHPRRN